MKTMIKRVCDIKIIVNPIIRKIIVQTEWGTVRTMIKMIEWRLWLRECV